MNKIQAFNVLVKIAYRLLFIIDCVLDIHIPNENIIKMNQTFVFEDHSEI